MKYVELSCTLSTWPLLVQLVLNAILVIFCTYYAFQTRKLPDNFNESKFISFTVYSTVVMWLAFIPTYFTASKSKQKSTLLAVALLLNATVALLCLFSPKIYALFTMKDGDMNINTAFSSSFGSRSFRKKSKLASHKRHSTKETDTDDLDMTAAHVKSETDSIKISVPDPVT